MSEFDDVEQLKGEIERLAHGICDVVEMLNTAAFFESANTETERAILRGLLTGTAHEGHRR